VYRAKDSVQLSEWMLSIMTLRSRCLGEEEPTRTGLPTEPVEVRVAAPPNTATPVTQDEGKSPEGEDSGSAEAEESAACGEGPRGSQDPDPRREPASGEPEPVNGEPASREPEAQAVEGDGDAIAEATDGESSEPAASASSRAGAGGEADSGAHASASGTGEGHSVGGQSEPATASSLSAPNDQVSTRRPSGVPKSVAASPVWQHIAVDPQEDPFE